jgi:putative tricarboxylic transport membrane protein
VVLGPAMESHLRRSLILSHGDPMIFMQRPVAAGILLVSCCVLGWTIYGGMRMRQRIETPDQPH